MDSTPEQWRVGDKCMAPYSEDSMYYRASIQSIHTNQRGNILATVQFSGFAEDENEQVNVRCLKKRPARLKRDGNGTGTSSSVQDKSPLQYVNEDDRLRAKYADLFASDLDDSPFTKRSKPREPSFSPPPFVLSSSASNVSRSTKKRKTPVAVGGRVKEGVEPSKRSPASLCTETTRVPVIQTSELGEKDSFGSFDEGFSSEDLEKPFFPGVSSCSAKIPLVLSSADADTVIQVPATINRYLRDYQREGVKFLYQHYKKGEGAILGDDMGLGKTVQVLAFLCAVLGKTGTREDCQRRLPEFLKKKLKNSTSHQSTQVFLIICPNSVLYNWLEEFETWTYCTVGKYHGRERQETLWKAMKGKLDAVITSYETYRIYMDSLLKLKWAGVIVDEVHKIKEPGSQITKALKDINTMCRYGLTGTALQNKVSELWCVLDWAIPNSLGSWANFKDKFEVPISKGQKFDASKRELAESRKVSEQFAELRDLMMIRRTKDLISHQLPQKEEKVVFCKLSELQLSVYKALLESDDMQLILKQKDICDCGSRLIRVKCCYRYNPDGEKVKSLTLTFMSLLIKVANHIALLTPDVSMSNKQRQRAKKYCDIAFARHPQFVTLSREARFCTLSDPSYCGKMQILEKLLGVFKREGSKVLLFSYYTQLLNIIEMYLKTTDYEYRRLDGKTAMYDRQRYVHEFNADANIFLFLISTKAGGLGLNLTGANVVVIFDPNWNPTYDLQAQDRAYRIGQHRDVRVYRLISTGSIEENMYLRQIYKQQLASAAVTSENPMRYFTAVAGDKKQQGELFGLQNMFAFRADTSCLTKDLIQRHAKTELGLTMVKYIPPTHTEYPTSMQSQNFRKDDKSDSDDAQSNHSNQDLTTCDMNIHDDHGVASQITSDSDSSIDNDDDDTRNRRQSLPVKKWAITAYSMRTLATESRHYGEGKARKPTSQEKPNQEWITSESSSEEEDVIREKRIRGKAILHKDWTVERRAKGQPNHDVNKHCVKGQMNNIKKSKPRILAMKHDRRSKGTRSHDRPPTSDKLRNEDAVNDIFKECGVDFIHSNLKIVGGSRVEDHVSKIAVRDVYELFQNSQQPANYNVPTLQESAPQTSSQESNRSSQSNRALQEYLLGQSQQASYKMNGRAVLFGQTPRGIRRCHFEAMAKTLNYSSSSDFANFVLSLSSEQYSILLKDYYSTKHPCLDLNKLYDPPESASDNQVQPPSNLRKPTGCKASPKPAKILRKKKVTSSFEDNEGCESKSLSEEEERKQCKQTKKLEKVVHRTKGTKTKVTVENHVKTPGPSTVHEETSKARPKPSGEYIEDTDDSLEVDQCTSSSKNPSRILHQEENLSFLDDIFILDQSKKPCKPPPKNKSPRIPKKKTTVDDTFSDSDIEMEAIKGNQVPHSLSECDQLTNTSNSTGSLWKRNSKFTTRQSMLDQVTTEANLENRPVYEKYATSFVQNERYNKRDSSKRCDVNISETLTEEDNCKEAQKLHQVCPV
ncbi:DNA excision repair protein ERCC-6-like 2 isoform X2 [Asterias rubens]|uniref:DNA excision repair protein ERCC-6-like 2 isoform X2 n=1 Tax=Asterias rubens TaxID=7604 RepID=UPI0014552B0A|nr:DNA excision repair protein ERCC-6-like 2 isoform X2 [Asterias rubens]